MEKLKCMIMKLGSSVDPNRPLSPSQISLLRSRFADFLPLLHAPTHPPYSTMIWKAITELNEENGSTEESISMYIKANYEDLPWAHNKYLSHHLNKLCENNTIVITSGKGYTIPGLVNVPYSKRKRLKLKSTKKEKKCAIGEEILDEGRVDRVSENNGCLVEEEDIVVEGRSVKRSRRRSLVVCEEDQEENTMSGGEIQLDEETMGHVEDVSDGERTWLEEQPCERVVEECNFMITKQGLSDEQERENSEGKLQAFTKLTVVMVDSERTQLQQPQCERIEEKCNVEITKLSEEEQGVEGEGKIEPLASGDSERTRLELLQCERIEEEFNVEMTKRSFSGEGHGVDGEGKIEQLASMEEMAGGEKTQLKQLQFEGVLEDCNVVTAEQGLLEEGKGRDSEGQIEPLRASEEVSEEKLVLEECQDEMQTQMLQLDSFNGAWLVDVPVQDENREIESMNVVGENYCPVVKKRKKPSAKRKRCNSSGAEFVILPPKNLKGWSCSFVCALTANVLRSAHEKKTERSGVKQQMSEELIVEPSDQHHHNHEPESLGRSNPCMHDQDSEQQQNAHNNVGCLDLEVLTDQHPEPSSEEKPPKPEPEAPSMDNQAHDQLEDQGKQNDQGKQPENELYLQEKGNQSEADEEAQGGLLQSEHQPHEQHQGKRESSVQVRTPKQKPGQNAIRVPLASKDHLRSKMKNHG